MIYRATRDAFESEATIHEVYERAYEKIYRIKEGVKSAVWICKCFEITNTTNKHDNEESKDKTINSLKGLHMIFSPSCSHYAKENSRLANPSVIISKNKCITSAVGESFPEFVVMKEIPMANICTEKEVQHTWGERSCLEELKKYKHLRHSVVMLYECFKDDNNLYFIMELVIGGPLHRHIRWRQGFDYESTKFYTALIVRTLGFIHSYGYVHRDLKASNLVITESGALKLVDFGFAKKLSLNRANSFCGTLHSMSPEVYKLRDNQFIDSGCKSSCGKKDMQLRGSACIGSKKENIGYGFEVDWWSLGVLVFEMLTNSAPFGYYDYELRSDSRICELVKSSPASLVFPESPKIPSDAKEFICRLLDADSQRRLGSNNDAFEVSQHEFLRDVKWLWQDLIQHASHSFHHHTTEQSCVPPRDYDRSNKHCFELKNKEHEEHLSAPAFEKSLGYFWILSTHSDNYKSENKVNEKRIEIDDPFLDF